ncbi:MAG TPA: hypothetical protein VKA64_06980 [Gammaproteobacteria bacterium]|nr:hypothetical protein [Gammaproteobacteria bacterium]
MLTTTAVSRRPLQHGFTLTGLMVGSVVGMIVISAAITVYLTTVATNAGVLREIKLNQEVRTIMSIMVSDLRRAGYWDGATGGTLNNPFTIRDTATPANDTDVTIHNNGTCILYTYDATYQGTNNAGSADATGDPGTDYFGFRLSGSDIQMRSGGTNTSDCTDGNWETLNDDNTISIDTLTFSTEGSQCLNPADDDRVWQLADGATVAPCACTDTTVCTNYAAPDSGDLLVGMRRITITIEASHISDPTATVEYSQRVKVRNDRIVQEP